MFVKMSFPTAICAAVLCALPAQASTNLVTNGDFSSYNGSLGGIVGYNGGFNSPATVTGWTNTGYNFLMDPTVDDNGGVAGPFGNFQLWGPDNGSANGLAGSQNGTGGNYIAAEADPSLGNSADSAIYQTINGLTAGAQYTVTFDWAAAQQKVTNRTFTPAATTTAWLVSLDNSVLAASTAANTSNLNAYTQSTNVVTDLAEGFVPWTTTSMTFTAQGSTQILSFLATGGPNGAPPFALLDNVSLSAAVPEAPTWAMMIIGFGAVGSAVRRGREKAAFTA